MSTLKTLDNSLLQGIYIPSAALLSNIVGKMSSITQRLSTGTVLGRWCFRSHEITSQGARVFFRGGLFAGSRTGDAGHHAISLEHPGKPRN